MAVISKAVKADMLDALMNHAFAKRINDAEAFKRSVGDQVYADAYKDQLASMNSLPTDFFNHDRHFLVNWAGQSRRVDFTKAMPIPFCHRDGRWGNNYAKVYEADAKIMAIYDAACDQIEKIKREQSIAKSNAEALLSRCNTFQKLWKTWPESHSVLKHFDKPKDEIYLPAVVMPELNKALGLPVEANT